MDLSGPPYSLSASSFLSLLLKRGTVQVHKNPQPPAKPEKPKSRGFRNTLRNLRDRLRTDHKALVRIMYSSYTFSQILCITLLSCEYRFDDLSLPLSPSFPPLLRLQLALIQWSRGNI